MNQLIKIYKSTITNGPFVNLGGPPSTELQKDEYINGFFNWDSIHPGAEIFSVFYVKNDNYVNTSSGLSVALDLHIDYGFNRDILSDHYSRALELDVLRPEYATIGYEHPAITYDGFFVDAYPKRITDFVQNEEFGRRVLFIDDVLSPGEFFPFIVRLRLTEPVGPTFKQPIKINIYSGVF